MKFRRAQALFVIAATVSFFGSFVTPAQAGTVELTIVNIETPQGVKIWEPESIYARKGDTVTLKLINKLDKEHGYQIEAFGIKEVVPAKSSKTISFKADKVGIFPIRCQLHAPHVAGQLVVISE